MGYQQYAPAPGMPSPEPAEIQSIRSMLNIGRIIALIFGIIWILAGIGTLAAGAVASAYGYFGAGLVVWGILLIIWGVVDFVIWTRVSQIREMVEQRQLEAAKSSTLIWMIIGFIIGGILVGIFLLIAYIKFDAAINWQRSQGLQPPMAYAAAPPPPGTAPAAPPPPPPAPVVQPGAPVCPRCGQPTTYIAQYGRYYCYNDRLYV